MGGQSVIVIGAGIAGLTATALLAHEGIAVTLLEAHHQVGGCAGTFRRGPYVFDVGATQVAGMERGGIHERLFRYLNLPSLAAKVLDPGCLIDLDDGYQPIALWHDAEQWQEERKRQFPGSEVFWQLCETIHKSNWAFASRDPVLPIRNAWDLAQVLNSLGPISFASSFLSTLSVADLLMICGCANDKRLRQFLDLQLRLYSQEPAHSTAALYGATVLQMAQAPLGLWHLYGSMQKLSNHLTNCLLRDGGKLLLQHRVVGLKAANQKTPWEVEVMAPNGSHLKLNSFDVVCTLPPQCLLELMPSGSGISRSYQRCLEQLPKPKGALVFYGAIDRIFLPSNCPSHLQLAANDPGAIFISISQDGDGRAPIGKATIIASVFTDTDDWCSLNESLYQKRKQQAFSNILKKLENWFGLLPQNWLHKEFATPRSFAKWTGRPNGIVGGLGQKPSWFGPFGLPSRTPLKGLWLCGDSIHPGEGTAGVSQSALMVCRQLMANRGYPMNIPQ